MLVVVVGLGEVGRHLVRTLEWEHHDVVAVDLHEDAIRQVQEHHDVMTLQGYGASPRVLAQARAAEADLVVAVTDDDEVNLVAALAARGMGAKRTVARVQGRAWSTGEDAAGVEYGLLGVDVVFNPQLLVARELAKIAQSIGASEVIDLANDRIEIVAIDLDEQSRHTRQPLSRIPFPSGVLAAALVHDGELKVPGGNDRLSPGDRVYLVGLPQQMHAAESLFARGRNAGRVTVVGGGAIGEHLAHTLSRSRVEVTLIERDKARAHALKRDLPDVNVVYGDGTDMTLLQEYEVDRCDLFAAVTREDEVNLMAALLAQRAGAKRTGTVVYRMDYVEIHKQLGIHVTLSPRQLATEHVLRLVRHEELKSIASLEGGRARILEIHAVEGARAVGVPVQRMNLPQGSALLCAILKRDSVVIPHGSSVIDPGDTVIVLAVERAIEQLVPLFKQRAF